jgi:hypothetical protein
MKVDLFKKLIKEAVAEAVREELTHIFEQQSSPKINQIQENKTLNFTSNDVMSVRTNLREKMGNMFGFEESQSQTSTLKVDTNSENPYLAFLADSAANMTPQERAGLKNLG